MTKPLLLAALLVGFSFLPCSAQGMRNGLPATTMDSFVYNAGGMADMIYGDEGVDDIPPLFGYSTASRINSGIFGQSNAGLTTGHGSMMPSATGADEFLGGEWSLSGANGGNLDWVGVDPSAPVNLTNQTNAIASANNAAQAAYGQMQTFQNQISAAQAVISNPTSTAQQIATAQENLAIAQSQYNNASQAFTNAQQAAQQAQSNFSSAAAAAEASTSF